MVLTTIVLLIGLIAPWVEMKIGRYPVRPFIFAFLVVLGILPFTHWLIVTPNLFRDQLMMVNLHFLTLRIRFC